MDRGQKQDTMPKILVFITVYLKVEKDNVSVKDPYTIKKILLKNLSCFSNTQIPKSQMQSERDTIWIVTLKKNKTKPSDCKKCKHGTTDIIHVQLHPVPS